MSEFKAGQRVRVTKQYAKNIHPHMESAELEEVGTEGTVLHEEGQFFMVALDGMKVFGGDYLFSPDELELV